MSTSLEGQPAEANDVAVSVKVAVRVRPLSSGEKKDGSRSVLKLDQTNTLVDAGGDRKFDFDYLYGPNSAQSDIYQQTTIPLLNRVMDGFNATILAYGQTGSGKTFTMGTAFGGNGGLMAESAGIIPRAVSELFQRKASMKRRVHVRVSFLEIHNEEIRDLLTVNSSADCVVSAKGLAVRETLEGGLVVAGLSSHPVSSSEEVEQLLARGTLCRATAATQMNAQSSRSHAICTLTLDIGYAPGSNDENGPATASAAEHNGGEDEEEDEDAVEHVGKLTLVDLAGSERAKRTGASGERLKEGISINRGLLALGNVIKVLADTAQQGAAASNGDSGSALHVPYRDSKLTRMLQESLGGSSHTLMLACVSPADVNLEETANTLRYAHRARAIKNLSLKNVSSTAAIANANAAAECVVLKREIRLLRLQLLQNKGSRLLMGDDDDDCGGGGGDVGNGGGGSVALSMELQGCRSRLEATEARLRCESEAGLGNALRADRLALVQEQLLAAAKAKGYDLDLAGGSFNPLHGSALNDDGGGDGEDSEESGSALSVVEGQRREISKLRQQVGDLTIMKSMSSSSPSSSLAMSQKQQVRLGSDGGDYGAGGDAAADSSIDGAEEDGQEMEAAELAVHDMERQAEAMATEQRCMEALRLQFAGAIERLQAEVNFLQQQNDDEDGGSGGGGGNPVQKRNNANNPPSSQDAEQRLALNKALESKLKELERKQKEYARAVALKDRAEGEASRLKSEVSEAKRRRADLIKEGRAEAVRHAKEMAEGKRVAVRAVRDAEKSGAKAAKAQQAQEKTEHMLKQKHQEVTTAMRRIKEQQKALMGAQKSSVGGAASSAAAAGGSSSQSSQRNAELRKWVEHEFNMGVAVASCRALLANNMKERSGLAQRLALVKGALGAAVDEAIKTKCDSGGDEAALLEAVGSDEECVALQREAALLEAKISNVNANIDELQDGVLASDQQTTGGSGKKATSENESSSKWAATVKSLSECKAALTHLLSVAVAKRVDATEKRQQLEHDFEGRLEAALKKQGEQHSTEVRSVRMEMTEKMVLALQATSSSSSLLPPISEGDDEGSDDDDDEEKEKGEVGASSAAAVAAAAQAKAEASQLRAWKEAATAELSTSREQLEESLGEIEALRSEVRAQAAALAVAGEALAVAEGEVEALLVSNAEQETKQHASAALLVATTNKVPAPSSSSSSSAEVSAAGDSHGGAGVGGKISGATLARRAAKQKQAEEEADAEAARLEEEEENFIFNDDDFSDDDESSDDEDYEENSKKRNRRKKQQQQQEQDSVAAKTKPKKTRGSTESCGSTNSAADDDDAAADDKEESVDESVTSLNSSHRHAFSSSSTSSPVPSDLETLSLDSSPDSVQKFRLALDEKLTFSSPLKMQKQRQRTQNAEAGEEEIGEEGDVGKSGAGSSGSSKEKKNKKEKKLRKEAAETMDSLHRLPGAERLLDWGGDDDDDDEEDTSIAAADEDAEHGSEDSLEGGSWDDDFEAQPKKKLSKAKTSTEKSSNSSKAGKGSFPVVLPGPIDTLTVNALKDCLRSRGLTVSGKKQDLVARLQTFLDAHALSSPSLATADTPPRAVLPALPPPPALPAADAAAASAVAVAVQSVPGSSPSSSGSSQESDAAADVGGGEEEKKNTSARVDEKFAVGEVGEGSEGGHLPEATQQEQGVADSKDRIAARAGSDAITRVAALVNEDTAQKIEPQTTTVPIALAAAPSTVYVVAADPSLVSSKAVTKSVPSMTQRPEKPASPPPPSTTETKSKKGAASSTKSVIGGGLSKSKTLPLTAIHSDKKFTEGAKHALATATLSSAPPTVSVRKPLTSMSVNSNSSVRSNFTGSDGSKPFGKPAVGVLGLSALPNKKKAAASAIAKGAAGFGGSSAPTAGGQKLTADQIREKRIAELKAAKEGAPVAGGSMGKWR